MRINGGQNPIAMQHMAPRAREARELAGWNEQSSSAISATSTSSDGNVSSNAVTGSGKNLPHENNAADHPDHATGLQRAIERLRENAQKSPEAKGLQQALEMLQRNSESSGSVDLQA